MQYRNTKAPAPVPSDPDFVRRRIGSLKTLRVIAFLFTLPLAAVAWWLTWRIYQGENLIWPIASAGTMLLLGACALLILSKAKRAYQNSLDVYLHLSSAIEAAKQPSGRDEQIDEEP